MKHTLLSRFQGSWLGSAIGESLVNPEKRSPTLSVHQDRFSAILAARNRVAEEIINSPSSSLDLVTIWSSLKSGWGGDDIALFLLPLIMFYVDDFNELREIVTHNHSYSPEAAENIQDGLIWGSAIALALREKLDVNNLIEPILSRENQNSTQFMKQLKIVNKALKNGTTINQVVEELFGTAASSQRAPYPKTTESNLTVGKTALALSLYCFGVAPEDFELAMSLASSNQGQAKNVTALTGALSGAYNGLIGIPLRSRMMTRQNPIYQQTMIIIAKLFNIWSGACELLHDDSQLAIVAPPGTIQTRSSLKIISQTD